MQLVPFPRLYLLPFFPPSVTSLFYPFLLSLFSYEKLDVVKQ